ncbi:gamma-glutamylcyclotransferase [Methanobrevibacter sp.]|uniref:gamma-glutamylcyclotransferase family protein n=1 Tax=Methanobrevibacter sp. TaxID=66852 RepID=UPI003864CDEB
MKILKLNKQKCNEPKFDELDEMISGLEYFFDEKADFKDIIWEKNLSTILDFQDDDGSFKLFDSYKIPSDARVDFCYILTYLCTATLIKAFLTDSESFTSKEKSALSNGLKASCARNLRGHGYEAFKGQIEALNIFIKAGLNEFIDLYPDLCPEFTEMIKKIISYFKDRESQENFLGPWGESYEDEIKAINKYFSQRKVFVYGTLMSGEGNHGYLDSSKCLGKAFIEGYDMYNVGWYPAIVPGDSLIIGELYQVPIEDIPSIDSLEGEGSLYAKKCETVTCAEGKTTFALVYVYLGDVSSLEKIPAWNEEYVWYVSYGSNMLEERFMTYIKGGHYEGSREYPPCEDTTPPVAVKAFDVPYDMYFAKNSSNWQYQGVSFLDLTKDGKALGVAYLITKDQFRHVATQENGKRYPDGNGWYGDIVDLDPMDGFEVKTITKKIPHESNKPSQQYLDTLADGIKENWPEKSDEDINDYLNDCLRR